MPVKDGLQALPRIRQRSPSSKVVVLSGIVADRFVAKALALGAAGYVPKAGDAALLLETLGQLFPHARSTEHLRRAETHTLMPDRVGGVASFIEHELQRQVQDVLDCAGTVREQASDPDAVRAAASSIERSARQLREQLHRLQALAVETPTHDEPVDVAALVHELSLDLKLTIEPHPFEVLVSGRCVVQGDLPLLRRALTELIDNAVEHTPSSTPIQLTVTARADDVAVVVLDRGAGLSEDVAQRLVEVGPMVPAAGHGGLGLAIARNVALAHGGDLTFDRPSGGGARFTMTLPLSRRPGL